MVCKNARNGPQNERKIPQTSANLKKCSFEYITSGTCSLLGQKLKTRAQTVCSSRNKSEHKKRYQWKVQVRLGEYVTPGSRIVRDPHVPPKLP